MEIHFLFNTEVEIQYFLQISYEHPSYRPTVLQ